jgi:hypothetical protein
MRAITVSNYGARPSITELPAPQAGAVGVSAASASACTTPPADASERCRSPVNSCCSQTNGPRVHAATEIGNDFDWAL